LLDLTKKKIPTVNIMSNPYSYCNTLSDPDQTACIAQVHAQDKCIQQFPTKPNQSACLGGAGFATIQWDNLAHSSGGPPSFQDFDKYCQTLTSSGQPAVLGCQIFNAYANFAQKKQ